MGQFRQSRQQQAPESGGRESMVTEMREKQGDGQYRKDDCRIADAVDDMTILATADREGVAEIIAEITGHVPSISENHMIYLIYKRRYPQASGHISSQFGAIFTTSRPPLPEIEIRAGNIDLTRRIFKKDIYVCKYT